MKILLKLDHTGEPYLILLSEKPVLSRQTQCTDAELLELFISKAKIQGVILKNESDMTSRNDYASIRLGAQND